MCTPLNSTYIDEFGDQASKFIGAYCSDILPTMSINKEELRDNYLQKMYLSDTYTNKTNYLIFRDQDFVSRHLI
jgi:hypothetical protein